jgi:hypothetical protein
MELRTPIKPASQAVPTKARRYRLLRGQHIETVMIQAEPGAHEGGNIRRVGGKLLIVGEDGVPLCEERVFRPGEIIETQIDLMRYNASDKPPKFGFADEPGAVQLTETSRVWDSAKETLEQFVARCKAEDGEPQKPPQRQDLAKMSEKELRTFAASMEIDVSKAKTREDLLKIVQAAG